MIGKMSERRSYPVPPDSTAWEPPTPSCMLERLYQDVDHRLIPNTTQTNPYELSSEPLPWYLVARSLRIDDQLQDVDDFIRSVSMRLLMYHEVWIEIVMYDQTRDEAPFRVYEVNRVKRIKSGQLIQHIPDRSELARWTESGQEWPEYVELDADQMVRVQLPDAYPSELLRRVMTELANIEPLLPPSWVYRQVDGTMPNASIYNVNEAEWNSRLLTLKVSDPIGWTAREGLRGPGRRLNDYHYTLRELRFLHFIAALRQSAEQALREVLDIAGNLCGFEASVTANYVYSPEDVCELITQFEQGAITLTESLDIIFQRDTDVNPSQRRVV